MTTTRDTDGIIVVGAGGHAKVCIDILKCQGELVSFCVSGEGGPSTCQGIPVLTGDDHLHILKSRGFHRAFVAIGSNSVRLRFGRVLTHLGYSLVNALSPASTISSSVSLGSGIAVMPGAVVNAETHVSDLAIINTCATVDHDGWIGEAVHVGPNAALAGNVVIEDAAFLGIGSVVLPGLHVGEAAVVGAGAVVTSSVHAGCVVVGVPARELK